MAEDPSPLSARRREGRARACEGLLASRFGQRESQAGARALDLLRAQQRMSARREESPPTSIWHRWWPVTPGCRRIAPRLSGREQAPVSLGVWVAFAACVALLLGGLFFFRAKQYDASFVIGEVRGIGVVVERGTQTLTAAAGLRLRAGDTLRTPRGAKATLVKPGERMRVIVAESSELKLVSYQGSERIALNRGWIEAAVSSRPPESALVFFTPEAEAWVRGTHFTLAAKHSATWLEVIEGEVELKRREDGASTKVGTSHYAVAASGLELAARPDYERWQTPYSIIRSPAPPNAS